MKAKIKSSVKTLICGCLLLSTSILAQPLNKLTVPVIDNARVFAEFTDELPAVINYFTKYSEQKIIAFYQNSYGDILSKERKRGRLTVNFADQQHNIRIIISHQNKMQQVDVLVTKN